MVVLLATLAGAGAAFFLLRNSKPDVKVTFLGPASHGSNRVAFIITNISSRLVYYRVLTLAQTNGGVMLPTVWLMREDRELKERSAVNFDMLPGSTNRWKICVSYFDANSTPVAFETRSKLAHWTFAHHWERLTAWLDPTQRVRVAFGPDMLGRSPASASQP